MLSTGTAVSRTRCGRNSSVAISGNGPRAVVFREPQLHREKVSLFIFFCRLRWLVCRSHDLRRFRSRVLQTRSTLDVCNDDYSLFLFANIMDYFAPAWQRLHTYVCTYRSDFDTRVRHPFHFVGTATANISRGLNVKYLSFTWIPIENRGYRSTSFGIVREHDTGGLRKQPLRNSWSFLFFFSFFFFFLFCLFFVFYRRVNER